MSRIRSCSIKDCKTKGDKVTLHSMPTSLKRQERWKKVLNSFLDDKIDDSTVVCSKHFKKSDYVTSLAGSKSLLCKTAVPSIFPSNMPKKQQEVVVRPRHQSRRAASKEALKQMQILLEDENDAVEIPDDDDIIQIPVVSPPKKKYKLTHRKSSDGNGNNREVLVLKSITPNITNHYVENNLELECWVEELEPCQKDRNKKLEEEEKALQSKLDELIKACKGEVVYKGDLTTVIEVSEHVQKTIQAVQASVNKPPIVLNNTVANPQPGFQLVMDPRLGLIVGTMPTANQTPTKQGKIQVATNLQATVTPTNQTPATNRRSRAKKQPPVVQQAPPPPPSSNTRSLPSTRSGPSPISTRSALSSVNTRSTPAPVSSRSAPAPVGTRSAPSPVSTRSAPSPVNTRSAPSPINTRSAPSPISTRSGISTKQSNKRTAPQPPPAAPPATRSRRDDPIPSTPTAPATRSRPGAVVNARPTETSVEGGLTTGTNAKPKAIVDLTTDDGRPLPDSREISFNKLQGKTFPSLVVVARPHLRVADVNSDRAKLDGKVKSVLMYAPTKFTEWLIQQGLVKSEQKCSIHTATQLKLGMYSDVSKFPYSGGYVWISECCPQRFVSVFSGSIFEGSPHPPLVILKILYHWSCQTNIQNVTQWVKVDNLYVKGMYTWLRSICSVALQTHIRQLGGPQTKVEVGVISLGTTSQDGNSRQVKVEVLGILETSSKLIRLRAIEPLADGDRNYKKRFSKILEPLAQWVHPSSIIVTDLTVDKATLHQMGFSTVVQTTSVDANNSNRTIMEYLRRIVPRMFQNTLSLLSRQIIQQFLDELVWREWFGTTSMQAFDNLIIHLAEQTRFESNQSLIVKLNKVALNPFKNWGVSTTSTTATNTSVAASTPSTATKVADSAAKKRKRKEPEPPKPAPPKPAPAPVPEVTRPPKSTSPDVPEQMVPLENYYYGTIDNYPPKTNVTLNMKCPFCKESFNNNIVLMNHLFKHAHNVSQDGQMCRYCLTSVPTANDLLKHISTAHPAETKHDNGFVCLICETQYMNPFVLGKHMSKEHCPSELPYQCGTCGYRCSNHKQAIDHFYKQHDNGPTIQCPFCLKSTTVFSSSRNIAQNMHYFIQHLQKHQRKQYARRCGKCNLWFVQKDVLKEHQTKMHASQRGKTGLVPWIAPRNGVMVPKSKMDKYPCDAEGINFSTLFYHVSKNLKCKECDGLMDFPKHFPSFESCQNPNCQYSTCCSNAMQEHNAKCNKNSQHNVPKEKLPYEMFCICGYSSEDGNQMAKHLAVCERKSAYPSLSDAKSASVTHSMLDVLGLVRKPEETDKKQTAITRNIKRIVAKIEPEPETITLDEDEPSDSKSLEDRTKKMKKDVTETSSKEESKTDSIEKVTEPIAVDNLGETIEKNKDSEEVNMDTQEINEESEQFNQETEKINKEPENLNKETEKIKENIEEINKKYVETDGESETFEKETRVIEKGTEIMEKETETIQKETQIIEKENPVIEEEVATVEHGAEPIKKYSDLAEKEPADSDKPVNETEQARDTGISETEERPLSVEPAETSNIEDEEFLSQTQSPITEMESRQPDKEVENIAQFQTTGSENQNIPSEKVDCEKIQTTDKDAPPEKAGDEQSQNRESSFEQTVVDQSQTIEAKDKVMLSEETEEKQSQITETKDKDESTESKDELAEDKDESTEDKDESTEDKDESSEDKDESSEDKDESSDDKDESSEETEVDQSRAKETEEPGPETYILDSVESPSTPSEEIEKVTEVSQQFEAKSEEAEKSPKEDEDNEEVDMPTNLAGKDVTNSHRESETMEEQDKDVPVNEGAVEETPIDNMGDMMMGKFNSEINKEPEHVTPLSAGLEESSNDKFENISDRDENVSQLRDISSPVEDLPSTAQGVYDDVSESSDNAASKYLEDPEAPIPNLSESGQAGGMDIGEVENQERILESMDYEDISNTGLDSLTSMETD